MLILDNPATPWKYTAGLPSLTSAAPSVLFLFGFLSFLQLLFINFYQGMLDLIHLQPFGPITNCRLY